jgi:transcriptional regulator with XRE-family HTH domain
MSPDALTSDLGQRLKTRRDQLNLSQIEAAAHLGVSPRTLQNWEAGASFPWPKHRRAVAAFLEEQAA